jgi:hypothetical protein
MDKIMAKQESTKHRLPDATSEFVITRVVATIQVFPEGFEGEPSPRAAAFLAISDQPDGDYVFSVPGDPPCVVTITTE